MKIGWDPDLYPSSLDYEEALKSGKHFKNITKEISSQKRIFDAQHGSKTIEQKPIVFRKPKGSLRAIVVALVIIGSIISPLVEVAKPAIKEFLNGKSDSVTTVETVKSSELTSDVEMSVYRISASTDAIKNLQIPNNSSLMNISSGINSESMPYLVVSENNQTFDLMAISSSIEDSESMAPFLNDTKELLDGVFIDYAFPDLDQDGNADVLMYLGKEGEYPIIEVFLNQTNEQLGFTSMGYFESFPHTNITSTGLIQRIDDNEAIYDEIIVDLDGVRILESK